MPTFSPPTIADESPVSFDPVEIARNPLGFRLFRHFSPRVRGRSVLKTGGVYRTVDTPTSEECDAASEVYLGGHVYSVSYEVADALIDAGYVVSDVEGYPDQYEDGYG